MILLWVICFSPDAHDVDQALAAALQFEAQRAFALARQQYEAVAVVAPERAASVGLAACNTHRLASEWRAGALCYERLAARLDLAMARYHAAILYVDAGDAVLGTRLAMNVVEHSEDERLRERALTLVRGVARQEGGAAAELALLLEVGARLAARSRSPEGVYIEAARVALHMGDPTTALSALEEIQPRKVLGVWADDALITYARALRAQKCLSEALTAYRELRQRDSSSWFVGSYTSEFFDDATLELAETLLELGHTGEARSLLSELASQSSSRLADDAAFLLAQLALNDGNAAPMRRFVKDFAASRHVREATVLLGKAP